MKLLPNQTIAYADCFSGVSGDMFLGALLDLGLPLKKLQNDLSLLNLTGYTIDCRKKEGVITATELQISIGEEQPPRSWQTIRKLITDSDLSKPVKQRSFAIFELLAKAEGKVHGCPPEKVHFHEVGSVDSIIDIVGAAIGLEYFKIQQLTCSPLPIPTGWTQCSHGLLPLPAPAVCEILQDVQVCGVTIETELVTPTGAAIIKASACSFGTMPAMIVGKTGYGCGSKDLSNGQPNLLRLVLGQNISAQEEQEVVVIETNLDDWAPEGFSYISEKLFKHGALDVVLIPIQMKKGRPGFTFQVISPPAFSHSLKEILLNETSAIGLRYRKEQRWTLPRESGIISTCYGEIKVKKTQTPAGIRLSPEYEDCRRVATKTGLPLSQIYLEVQRQPIANFKGVPPDKSED